MLTCACARLRIIMNEGHSLTRRLDHTVDRELAGRVYWLQRLATS